MTATSENTAVSRNWTWSIGPPGLYTLARVPTSSTVASLTTLAYSSLGSTANTALLRGSGRSGCSLTSTLAAFTTQVDDPRCTPMYGSAHRGASSLGTAPDTTLGRSPLW